MSIYMITSFILFAVVAVMYFFDQRHMVLRELQDEMIAYISLSRNGNNTVKNHGFTLDLQPSKHYQYPIFYEDIKKNEYVSITCASKYQPDHVFIVSADKSVINTKLRSVIIKISSIMGIGFLLFLGLAYYLARISIRPIQQSRDMVDHVIEDILHDLNAPMTAISINCESLESVLEGEKERKKVERIVKSNKTIRFLYNNLQLLLDRPLPLNNVSFDVAEILADRIAFYSDLHPEARFESTLESVFCDSDSAAFERVIDNLLSNAIKYSQPDPEISVSCVKGKIIIEDNGIGIEDCNEIFVRHYREIQGAACACGLGLGLSIVKKLCDQMGIAIELESRQHKGSRFTLHCP